MSIVTLENAVKTRGYTRQRVTKLCSKVESELLSLSVEQCNAYADRLQILRNDLLDSGKLIMSLAVEQNVSDGDFERLMKEDDDYEGVVALILSKLKVRGQPAAAIVAPTLSGIATNNGVQTINKLKLPQVTFPKFSNKKGENVQEFLRSFESIIDKHCLGSYVKFVHLREQCSGPPRILVDSLEVAEQSFETAKDLLIKAFDSDLVCKYKIIQKLAELKLPAGSEPYEFIGEMRTILAGVRSQEISTDDILQYFIWHALNIDFQAHLVSITNKTRPNLEQIQGNIFEATERYNKQMEEKKTTKFRSAPATVSAAAAAINVDLKKTNYTCFLCSSDKKSADHSMFSCPNYDNARKKVDKLKSLNACANCSFRNHTTANCHFNFKSNCRHCLGKHMSYLCLKPNTGAQSVTANVVSNDHDEYSEPETSVSRDDAAESEEEEEE